MILNILLIGLIFALFEILILNLIFFIEFILFYYF